jgi:SET domain-containing protein 6
LFQEEEALVMRAIKPIKAGEEIFNDYGELPSSDLLRRYGYVTDNYAKYDVAELPIKDLCHAAEFHKMENEFDLQVYISSSCLVFSRFFTHMKL